MTTDRIIRIKYSISILWISIHLTKGLMEGKQFCRVKSSVKHLQTMKSVSYNMSCIHKGNNCSSYSERKFFTRSILNQGPSKHEYKSYPYSFCYCPRNCQIFCLIFRVALIQRTFARQEIPLKLKHCNKENHLRSTMH